MNRHIAIRCCFVIAAAVPGSLMSQPQPLASIDVALRTESDPRKIADLIWSTVFLRCGESYFSLQEDSHTAVLTEYKRPTFSLVPQKVSPADSLNGVQWAGVAKMRPIAARRIDLGYDNSAPGWSEWIGPDVISAFSGMAFGLSRTNGRWSWPDLTYLLISRKLSCADAASKDPFARYKLPTSQEFDRAYGQLEKMKQANEQR